MEFNATFLIAAISFIVFVIIMNFIFYKPIEKIVNKREAFIDGNFDEAQKNNLTSQKLNDDYNKKIDAENFQGKTIINEKSDLAKAEKNQLIAEAKVKAAEEITNNQTELNKVYDTAKNELEIEAKNLAEEISAKLFGLKGGNEEC